MEGVDDDEDIGVDGDDDDEDDVWVPHLNYNHS